MARDNQFEFLITTRASLETQKGLGNLIIAEPYYISDEGRLAIGTGTGAYVDFAKKSEVDAKLGTADLAAGVKFYDTRDAADQPVVYAEKSVRFDFKTVANAGSPPVSTGSVYSHIMTVTGWLPGNTGGGGQNLQLAFGDHLALRQSTSETTWGPWRKIRSDLPSTIDYITIGFEMDGGGAAITTGAKAFRNVEGISGVIEGWTLVTDAVGNFSIDLWKDTYANYPPTSADTISGSSTQRPRTSAANKGQSADLTGWSTTINVNDVLVPNVVENTGNATWACLTLKVRRT